VMLSDLAGLWRRSLLIRPDGTRDTTTRVWWLQGAHVFIDLRQPANPPDFSGVRGLEDLCAEQCAWLAQQQGFAGRLVCDGSCFEWRRELDFQPDSGQPDAGTLHWNGDILVETGRDSPYVEHWHRDAHSAAVPNYSVTLRAPDRNVRAFMLRAGGVFMFAREREHEYVQERRHRSANALPLGGTLSEHVAAAGDLAEMQALLNCEISFGEVRGDDFHITVSTLPYRVGDVVDPRRASDSISIMDRTPKGELVRCNWLIAEESAMADRTEPGEKSMPP
jgi:hypothetical protein